MPRQSRYGRPLAWSWRAILNAIFYIMRTGCPWRFLPDGFPPWQTVYRWFVAFRDGDRRLDRGCRLSPGTVGGRGDTEAADRANQGDASDRSRRMARRT